MLDRKGIRFILAAVAVTVVLIAIIFGRVLTVPSNTALPTGKPVCVDADFTISFTIKNFSNKTLGLRIMRLLPSYTGPQTEEFVWETHRIGPEDIYRSGMMHYLSSDDNGTVFRFDFYEMNETSGGGVPMSVWPMRSLEWTFLAPYVPSACCYSDSDGCVMPPPMNVVGPTVTFGSECVC